MRYALIFALIGCGGGSGGAQRGELGGPCYQNGTCNANLECSNGVCIADDAGVDDPPDVLDGGFLPDAFACLDDSAFEPNETTQTAFVTPVDTQQTFTALAAICPAADKDHFGLNVTANNRSIEVITSWTAGDTVNVSLLNQAGNSLGNGTPMGANAMRVCLPNLPVGRYFAFVFAAAGAINNYQVMIRVVNNC